MMPYIKGQWLVQTPLILEISYTLACMVSVVKILPIEHLHVTSHVHVQHVVCSLDLAVLEYCTLDYPCMKLHLNTELTDAE